MHAISQPLMPQEQIEMGGVKLQSFSFAFPHVALVSCVNFGSWADFCEPQNSHLEVKIPATFRVIVRILWHNVEKVSQCPAHINVALDVIM